MGKTARYLQFRVKGTGDTIKPKFFNVVSQVAHFGAWYFLVTILAGLSGKFLGMAVHGVTLGLSACLAYSVWHGFFWKPPQAPTPGSGAADSVFMILGGLTGALAYTFLMR